MADGGSLLVLGLGNLLCGDDGLGVVAVERLLDSYTVPPGVRVLDGGTLGLSLIAHVHGADDLLLVDAIQTGQPAGTCVRLEGEEVAPAVRHRLSVHQIGVADLLDALRLMDAWPRRVVLLGVVPKSMELEVGLSPEVEAAIPELITRIAEEARALGHPLNAGGDGESSADPGPRNPRRALGL